MSRKIEAEEITSRRKLLVGVAGVAAGAGLLATGGAAPPPSLPPPLRASQASTASPSRTAP